MHNLTMRFAQKARPLCSLLLIIGATFCICHVRALPASANLPDLSAQKTFPIQRDWGIIQKTPTGLKLELKNSAVQQKISIPRMNNRIKTIYVAGDAEKKPLTLKPGITEWEISVPQATSPGATIIVEFKEAPYLPVKPAVATENADQQIILDAKDAVVHGKLLRYEPQPHKNTVGYWANENDWCEWMLDVPAPGVYDVYVLQGCGRGQGGSEVEVSVKDQKINFTVEDTGHFQNFKERHIGQLKIDQSGLQSLHVKPLKKAKNAVMDVRQMRLVRQ